MVQGVGDDIRTFRDLAREVEKAGEMDRYIVGTFLTIEIKDGESMINAWNVSAHKGLEHEDV